MIIEGIELRNEKLPATAGSWGGVCLVLGSGQTLFEDVRDAIDLMKSFKIRYDVVAVNLSFLAYPGEEFKHLVTLHQEKLAAFHELAKTLPKHRHGQHIHTHSHMATPDVENVWDIVDLNGTSSIFATKIARLLGYEQIILCGVPLTGNHRFYDNPYLSHDNNFGCTGIEFSWHTLAHGPIGWRIRSMSGKTEKLFGRPTAEWADSLRNKEAMHGNK